MAFSAGKGCLFLAYHPIFSVLMFLASGHLSSSQGPGRQSADFY